MGSKISYNIHAQMVKDVTRLKKHLLKVQPASVLVMDGLGLAREIKAWLPNCIVIHRNYGVTKGDDNVHKRISPEAWLDLRATESQYGIWLYTTNEPGYDQNSIDWHVKLMELAAPAKIPLVVGNFGVGTPGADDWGQAQRMLELLDQHRDLFILGLHEYACGVITSGLYGGYPDNAGVQPGTPDGKNLISKDKWPQDVSAITLFHMGRFEFLVKYCERHGLKPPRIILTEHGMDDVSDIKPWAEKLIKTDPYQSIRGWKSLRNQWVHWFNVYGWSAERAYFEQLAWADRVIYRNSPVEAQLVYCWAHSSEDWEQFDVAEASEFQDLLEAYAQQSVITQPVGVSIKPTPIPKPANAGEGVKVIAENNMNLREGYGEKYDDIGDPQKGEIQTGNLVLLYNAAIQKADDATDWCWAEVLVGDNAGKGGWVSLSVFRFHESVKSTQEMLLALVPDAFNNAPFVLPPQALPQPTEKQALYWMKIPVWYTPAQAKTIQDLGYPLEEVGATPLDSA